jgi:hypothetical protein
VSGIDHERAGAARGIAEAVEPFILAVPSLSGLALVLEITPGERPLPVGSAEAAAARA